VFACCLFAVALQGCVGKAVIDPPAVLRDTPSDVFIKERLKSHRGDVDFSEVIPANARRPQPDYDNYKYGGVNFYEHEVVYLEGNMVLVWKPRTAEYALYNLNRHPDNNCPAVPERPVVTGKWESRKFHKFLYIGCGGAAPGGKMFDYNPAEGTYEIWRFNHKAEAGTDPMIEVLSKGFRREVMNFYPTYLNEDELFLYESNTGAFSIYYINNQLPSQVDPLQPPEPLVYGKLQGLHEQIIYVGQNMILDYDPQFGRYWFYMYDRTSVENSIPVIGPLSSGVIEKGMVLSYIADDSLLMMDPETGKFAVFDFVRPAKYDAFVDEQKTPEQRDRDRFDIVQLKGPAFQIKKEQGNYGFGSIEDGNHCSTSDSCKSCLKRPGCGWCDTSSECYRGSTVEPCSTNCTSWQPVFCEAEPCSSHSTCSDCLSDPFCGFCPDTMSCVEGTMSGPLFGACEGWSKLSCPLGGGEAGLDGPAPCVEGGLISL